MYINISYIYIYIYIYTYIKSKKPPHILTGRFELL